MTKLFSLFNSTLGWIVALGISIATYIRIYYGIDFSDEGQYVGQAYMLMTGGKPFYTDLFIQQTAAFLFYPFIKIYIELMGSTEGIFLFVRHLYFLLSLTSAFTCYLFWKHYLSRASAAALSATVIAFIPFAIPSLSYNTIGHFFGLQFLHLTALAVIKKQGKIFFLSGLAGGLAFFAYPTLAVTIAFTFLLVVLWQWRHLKNWKMQTSLLPYMLGLIIPVLVEIVLLLQVPQEDLLNAWGFSKSFGVFGGYEKLFGILNTALQYHINQWPILVALALALAAKRFAPARDLLFPFLLIGYFIFLATATYNGTSHSHEMLITFAIWSTPVLVFKLVGRNLDFPTLIIACSSFLSGLLMAWTSTNGLYNAAMGLTSVALVTLFLLIITQKREISRVLCIAVFGSAIVFSQYTFVYRDDLIPDLDSKIESGAFAGLVTHYSRKQFIEQIETDLQKYSDGRSSVLFYDHFPAGYSMTSLKPLCRTLFMHHAANVPGLRPFYIQYYSQAENLPDLVFEFFLMPMASGFVTDLNVPQGYPPDPLRNFFTNSGAYEVLSENPAYKVLGRKK